MKQFIEVVEHRNMESSVMRRRSGGDVFMLTRLGQIAVRKFDLQFSNKWLAMSP